jgi:hypothetical protein
MYDCPGPSVRSDFMSSMFKVCVLNTLQQLRKAGKLCKPSDIVPLPVVCTLLSTGVQS